MIDDDTATASKITTIAFCSGKVYYDLLEEKEKLKNKNTALVRIEQLFPFPKNQIDAIIKKYKKAERYLWVQEEPANMGPWEFIRKEMKEVQFEMIARPASGSPATGSPKFHAIRQQKILDKTFFECDCPYIYDNCEMACIGNKWKSFEAELKALNVEQIDSKFHSGVKPLK